MRPRAVLLGAVAICAQAVSAQGSDAAAAVQRCRQLAEPAARLACYDAAFAPTAASAPGAPLAAPAAVARAGAVPASPSSAGRLQDFGLERPKADADAVQTVESALADGFYGWGPNEKIRLRDGQVWQVVDGSSGSLRRAAATVTIRRGALGAYFMDFEGLNKSPRVRRLQ